MTKRLPPIHPKSTCCACRRSWTRKFEPGTVWLCYRCFRGLPKAVRRVWLRVVRERDERWTPRAEARAWRIFERIRKLAIERAAGIR